MNKLIIPALLIIASMLASCEQTVTDVDIPKVSPQLALFGFISPEQEGTTVELVMSKPVFGQRRQQDDFVRDATVIITNDGGQSAALTFADTSQAYHVPHTAFAIEPGRTYTITASSGSYRVKASCTVPDVAAVFSDASYQALGTSSWSGNPSYRFLYKWNDLPGGAHYYRTLLRNNEPSDFFPYEFCTNVYDDEGNEGKTLGGNCESSGYSSAGGFEVIFYLFTTDVHYYEYHKRRLNYFGDDPFSEPYPQYSNVEGGLGVFCAFRQSERVVRVAP